MEKPSHILTLSSSKLHSDFALYGLQLSVVKRAHAITALWQKILDKHLLSHEQQQQFIAYHALYQIMRNQSDASYWVRQVQPEYRNPTLREWEIRYALAHHQWQSVVSLTQKIAHPLEPSWQYWRARALENLGQPQAAELLYQSLAIQRNYYGFLASMRLKQPPHFQEETTVFKQAILAPYQPILTLLRELYRTQQTVDAGRILNDFTSELPAAEKGALLQWVSEQLRWYSRVAYMCTQDTTLYNQLSLRFPLLYRATVDHYAQQYHIDPALIFATIRQESIFSETIRSPAGACGLMQILPNTARVIAKHEKMSLAEGQDLFASDTNIHIGVAYMRQLQQQFKAHPVLMMAAYNAGPKQVNYWLKHHPTNDMDIWIETLPWQETRNYLKNIIAFYVVYQYRMQQTPDPSIFLQTITQREATAKPGSTSELG